MCDGIVLFLSYASWVMSMRKFRWSKDYESAEEELQALLKWRKVDAKREVKAAELDFNENASEQTIRLWCAEGSFMIKENDQTISMQPGDAIDIAPHHSYRIRTGIAGCIYYQASIDNS